MQDSDLDIPTEMPSLKDMIDPKVNILLKKISFVRGNFRKKTCHKMCLLLKVQY
jgi:hypothetical protein